MLRQVFSARLKQIRKQKKITQEGLAEVVGVSTSTIQRWEYADDAPAFDRIEVLARALNVRVRDLFDFGDTEI